jgi:hypothetical protein
MQSPRHNARNLELIYYWNALLGTDTILIAVSQSGRSAEMLRLIELNAGRSTLFGIINDLDSPLAQAANGVALISAGAESSVSCKTYICSLALSRIGDNVGRGAVKGRGARISIFKLTTQRTATIPFALVEESEAHICGGRIGRTRLPVVNRHQFA